MLVRVRLTKEWIDTWGAMMQLEKMSWTVVPYLMRAICLMLVIATGISGVAYADHGGGHVSHCIATTTAASPVAHDHAQRENTQPSLHDVAEEKCVQHSCVEVIGYPSLTGAVHRLVSCKANLGGDPLRAAWRAENLHRPPIV